MTTTAPSVRRLDHVPALDGLRGIAVLMVVLSHSWIVLSGIKSTPVLGWLVSGGILGVDVFFVLSGFLITALLMREEASAGRVSLGRFYRRRAARLLPALYVLLVAEAIYSHAIDYRNFFDSPALMRRTIREALTYTSNWQTAAQPLAPGDLGQLWSLAIEEQFYLVAPIVLIALLGLRRSKRTVAVVLLLAIVAVEVARVVVFHRDGWVPAYHMTTTRIDGLLIGVLLAALWVRRATPTKNLAALAWVATGVFVVVVAVARGEGAFLYSGGSAVFALAVAAIILASLESDWVGRRALGWRPLAAIGKVSYGIYLWHFPILGAFSRWHDGPSDEVRFVLALLTTALVTAASWFAVERPVLNWGRRLEARLAQRRASRRDGHRSPEAVAALRRFSKTAGSAVGLSLLPFCYILWDGRLNPLRLGVPEGFFGNFFELQARSMAGFRWNVPLETLSIEGFLHEGREYTYFPPFPSILRMPVLAFTDQYDGRLTALSLLLAWAVTATLTCLLLWRIRQMVRPSSALRWPEAVLHGAFIVTVLAGSTVTFLAAIPWVYHEPFAWAIASSLGALFCLLGVVERSTMTGIAATGVWTLVAVWSRTTMGWGCVAAVGLTGIWFAARRSPRSTVIALTSAAVIPFLAGALVTYLKFETFLMHPLDSQRWTAMSARRREALAANNGGLIGPQFFPEAAWTYLRPDGIRFTRWFPFISLPSRPPALNGPAGAKFDQTYRTGSVPATMPLLFVVAFVGVLSLKRQAFRSFRVPIVGAFFSMAGVLLYGYIGHRYVADFVPVLVICGALGVVAIAARYGTTHNMVACASVAVVMAAFGVAANTAVAYHALRMEYGGRELARYVNLQIDTAPSAVANRVSFGDQLPDHARADELFVVGDCRALYLGSGETMSEWVPVEMRGLHMVVTPLPDWTNTERYPLVRFASVPEMFLSVERDGFGRVRAIIDVPYFEDPGPWLDLADTDEFEIEVVVNTKYHILAVYVDGDYVGNVPTKNPNADQYVRQASPQLVAASDANAYPFDLIATRVGDTPVCERLTAIANSRLESAGIGDGPESGNETS